MLEFTTSPEGKIAAGVCVGVTVLLSGVLILQHLRHYKHPILQRYAIRIILMVPVYAVDSYISLWVSEYAFYINSCRDVYEAYVIYNFVAMVRSASGRRSSSPQTHTEREKPAPPNEHRNKHTKRISNTWTGATCSGAIGSDPRDDLPLSRPQRLRHTPRTRCRHTRHEHAVPELPRGQRAAREELGK